MVVNASRNVFTHSYAQVLNTRQTRPYFQGALISTENWVGGARLNEYSLTWPDPFRAAAYQLEIISAALQGSGIVHALKKSKSPVVGEC